MSKAQLLKKAAGIVGDYLGRASSQQVARASARIGTNIPARGAQAIVNTVKENPVTAALLLYEVGPDAAALLNELAAEDPRVAEVVEVMQAGEIDDIEEGDDLSSIGKFEDEFRSISDAIGMVGSLPRLLAIRRAVAVSDEVLAMYTQMREMTRGLR